MPVKTNFPTRQEVLKFFKLSSSGGILLLDGGIPPFIKDSHGYDATLFNGVYKKVHTLLWILHHGDIPEGVTIDHINRIRDDNNIENLRLATPSVQARNRSSFKNGISYNQKVGKYTARVSLKGERFYLGFYTSQENAEQDVEKAYSLIDEGKTVEEIKSYFNLTPTKAKLQSNEKGVVWCESSKKWRVTLQVNGKQVSFGSFVNETGAIDRVQGVRKMLVEGFSVDFIKRVANMRALYIPVCSTKGIDFKKGKYIVRKTLNGKRYFIGQFLTEQEANNALANFTERGFYERKVVS
jgi:hypothetical protein